MYRLTTLADGGNHYGIKMDPVDLHRLIAWVDACCPYMGEEEVRALGAPSVPGIEKLPIRPPSSHRPSNRAAVTRCQLREW
ncbi:MAG TPA: hypothetical protein VE890_09000 [Thermoguttaceae bacterium]|nr:hypothetical protein [Thermoguttaceae bacterium]